MQFKLSTFNLKPEQAEAIKKLQYTRQDLSRKLEALGDSVSADNFNQDAAEKTQEKLELAFEDRCCQIVAILEKADKDTLRQLILLNILFNE